MRPAKSMRDYSTIGFSFSFCALAAMNWAVAIPSQTNEAPNSSGINKKEAQNISVAAYSHREHSCWPSVKP